MGVGLCPGQPSRPPWLTLLGSTIVAMLAACRPDAEPVAREIRPVRAMTIEERATSVPAVLTGSIQAEDEAPLSFRIPGRVIERAVNLGDQVRAGQLVARLDPQNEQNAVRSAQASLSAAQGQLTSARSLFKRREPLVAGGAVSQVELDQAREGLLTAQAQVEAAKAQLQYARDQLSFAELTADAPGVVTAVGAEPGEVVQAGRMIAQLARRGGRDAVFDVPSAVIRSAPSDAPITVVLTDDRSAQASGRIREVSPQADPVTRTFRIKVGLTDPPAAMRLGATVTGRMEAESAAVIDVPATALTTSNRQPAVWIVDPETSTVSLRPIEVLRYDPERIVVSKGLTPGDVVVTAGVQALYPGQKVRLLGSSS